MKRILLIFITFCTIKNYSSDKLPEISKFLDKFAQDEKISRRSNDCNDYDTSSSLRFIAATEYYLSRGSETDLDGDHNIAKSLTALRSAPRTLTLKVLHSTIENIIHREAYEKKRNKIFKRKVSATMHALEKAISNQAGGAKVKLTSADDIPNDAFTVDTELITQVDQDPKKAVLYLTTAINPIADEIDELKRLRLCREIAELQAETQRIIYAPSKKEPMSDNFISYSRHSKFRGLLRGSYNTNRKMNNPK